MPMIMHDFCVNSTTWLHQTVSLRVLTVSVEIEYWKVLVD